MHTIQLFGNVLWIINFFVKSVLLKNNFRRKIINVIFKLNPILVYYASKISYAKNLLYCLILAFFQQKKVCSCLKMGSSSSQSKLLYAYTFLGSLPNMFMLSLNINNKMTRRTKLLRTKVGIVVLIIIQKRKKLFEKVHFR